MKFLPLPKSGLHIFAIFCLSITSASAKPRPPLPPAPEPGLLAAWRFNDPAEMKSLYAVNANTVESWSGYAMQMTGQPPAICAVPCVGRNGRTNINLAGPGTLRFWFSPAWTSASAGGEGAGNLCTLFEAGSWSDTAAHPQWSLIVNAEGTVIQLVVHSVRRTIGLVEVPIHWRAGEWHQVALSWSAAEGVALYVDGVCEAHAPGAILPAPSQTQAGVSIGGGINGAALAQGHFRRGFLLCTRLPERGSGG